MKSKKVKVRNYPGILEDAAFNLTRITITFDSSITLKTVGHVTNAKSLLSVLASRITNGTEVEIVANGKDEEEAVKCVSEYIQSGCSEEFVKNFLKWYQHNKKALVLWVLLYLI